MKEDVLKELDALLQTNKTLQRADFDGRARQCLHAIHSIGGQQKVKDAMTMIHLATLQKTRGSVRNWPAWVSKLLRKFFEDLTAELRNERQRAAFTNLQIPNTWAASLWVPPSAPPVA